jgi:hypothetical protein
MSWSLALQSGDLSLAGPAGYTVVTGPNKLLQDLRNWLLEKRGTDPLHPNYGSVLDGGMTRGVRTDSMIGSTINAESMMDVEVEIRRVLNEYQIQQADRLRRDMAQYGGRHTFAPNELLASVGTVRVRQVADVLVVHITLVTQSGQTLQLTQPLT